MEPPDDTVLNPNEIKRVAKGLQDLGDTDPVGPGTKRITKAACAIYTADRLTEGKAVTYDEMIAAAESITETSSGGLSRTHRS